MLNVLTSCFLILLSFGSFGQKTVSFQLDTSCLNQQFDVETFRCYISKISVTSSDGSIHNDPEIAHLLDIEDPNSWTIELPVSSDLEITSLDLILGTDSLTNVAGILEGDLDPIKGMYWAWNTGYINTKIEFEEKTTRQFVELHLGGYLPPHTTAQQLHFDLSTSNAMIVNVGLCAFLNDVEPKSMESIMIPGQQASELSRLFSTYITHE